MTWTVGLTEGLRIHSGEALLWDEVLTRAGREKAVFLFHLVLWGAFCILDTEASVLSPPLPPKIQLRNYTDG